MSRFLSFYVVTLSLMMGCSENHAPSHREDPMVQIGLDWGQFTTDMDNGSDFELPNMDQYMDIDMQLPTDEVAYSQGEQDYKSYCAGCHAEDGSGYVTARANALRNPQFLATASDELISQAIHLGREGTSMSAWGEDYGGPLSEDAVRNIIIFMRGWQTIEPFIPEPPSLEGSVTRGQIIYQSSCSPCHGNAGEGNTAVSLNNSLFLEHADDGFLAYAISEGRLGTWMLGYGNSLNKQEIADLVALIRSWQDN